MRSMKDSLSFPCIYPAAPTLRIRAFRRPDIFRLDCDKDFGRAFPHASDLDCFRRAKRNVSISPDGKKKPITCIWENRAIRLKIEQTAYTARRYRYSEKIGYRRHAYAR